MHPARGRQAVVVSFKSILDIPDQAGPIRFEQPRVFHRSISPIQTGTAVLGREQVNRNSRGNNGEHAQTLNTSPDAGDNSSIEDVGLDDEIHRIEAQIAAYQRKSPAIGRPEPDHLPVDESSTNHLHRKVKNSTFHKRTMDAKEPNTVAAAAKSTPSRSPTKRLPLHEQQLVKSQEDLLIYSKKARSVEFR